MNFKKSRLRGAFLIEIDKKSDERGYLARTFCAAEYRRHGLNPVIIQTSTSFNRRKGTLRGMHYQVSPFKEAKTVRCTRGSIYDVIVDLRKDSKTYRQWMSIVLTAENHRMVYIPEGFAHGFQTLSPNAEVLYYMSEAFAPQAARGFRWNDPAFRIKWPAVTRRIISPRDQQYTEFSKQPRQ